MTVVIVSQPLAGMALKRSFAQVVGTFAGAVVAVLIMALFAQQPLPFFVALGLWLALCTAGGTCCATPIRTPSCSAASPR